MSARRSSSTCARWPRRCAPVAAGCIHQVLGAAGAVAAFAVPQADEDHPCGTETRGALQHPEVIAFIGIDIGSKRPELIGRNMQHALALRGEIATAPIVAGKVDG